MPQSVIVALMILACLVPTALFLRLLARFNLSSNARTGLGCLLFIILVSIVFRFV
ncbi:MAG: hypothetical protein ACOY9Y_12730 [Bacillota bacterium]